MKKTDSLFQRKLSLEDEIEALQMMMAQAPQKRDAFLTAIEEKNFELNEVNNKISEMQEKGERV